MNYRFQRQKQKKAEVEKLGCILTKVVEIQVSRFNITQSPSFSYKRCHAIGSFENQNRRVRRLLDTCVANSKHLIRKTIDRCQGEGRRAANKSMLKKVSHLNRFDFYFSPQRSASEKLAQLNFGYESSRGYSDRNFLRNETQPTLFRGTIFCSFSRFVFLHS